MLYAKLENCEFDCPLVKYLVYAIPSNVIGVDERKTTIILTHVKEV